MGDFIKVGASAEEYGRPPYSTAFILLLLMLFWVHDYPLIITMFKIFSPRSLILEKIYVIFILCVFRGREAIFWEVSLNVKADLFKSF